MHKFHKNYKNKKNKNFNHQGYENVKKPTKRLENPSRYLTRHAKQTNEESKSQQLPLVAQTTTTASSVELATTTNSSTLTSSKYRVIVIDGSNVAFTHGNGKIFSCKGIQLVVNYFLQRGHTEIKAFVPRYRRSHTSPQNVEILDELAQKGFLVFTPSRYLNGDLIVPYDDRFIIRAAHHYNAVIVSNDNYSDVKVENPEWTRLVDTSLLQYTFVGDLFMVADDPMGRHGPSLEQFLLNSCINSDAAKQEIDKNNDCKNKKRSAADSRSDIAKKSLAERLSSPLPSWNQQQENSSRVREEQQQQPQAKRQKTAMPLVDSTNTKRELIQKNFINDKFGQFENLIADEDLADFKQHDQQVIIQPLQANRRVFIQHSENTY